MSYIQETSTEKKGCIFEAGTGKNHEKESLLLYRHNLAVALLNRYPYANGHLLLAPSRHISDIADLLPEESAALFALVQQSVAILRNHLSPDGFNVGLNLGTVAGAGQPEHLHFHVVPRWQGDHNFMTVLSEVRTIPEHIEKTFDQLLPYFQEFLFSKE